MPFGVKLQAKHGLLALGHRADQMILMKSEAASKPMDVMYKQLSG